MEENFADVNGVRLCYRIDGSGYPIILIHGFGSKKESFMAQIPELSKKFQVISYDSRGAGKSERPNMPYTMEIFADDIIGLIDYLKIKKAHIIGLSLGGMIALTLCFNYPKRVDKLILINTMAKLPDDFDPEVYIQTRIKGIKQMKQDPENYFWESTHFGFYHKFRRKMKNNPKEKFYGLWSVEDLLDYIQTNPPTPQDMRNIASSLKTYNAFNKLAKIKHNTLLLTAEFDRLVPKAKMFEIHKKMPNSIIKVIEKAGHESPKEKAPEVNEAIIEFLQKKNY